MILKHTVSLRSLVAFLILCTFVTTGAFGQQGGTPKLPAGMKGPDANDPRAKLTAGMYNAGETAMGIKHVGLVKKPDAFTLGTDNADDPKVKKILGSIGFPTDSAQVPKPFQLM